MLFKLGAIFSDDLSLWLEIAIIIFGILAFIAAVWSAILQIQIFFGYMGNNRRKTENGKTAKEVAEEMLEKLGYHDITVGRASWLWFIFFQNWGNRYSPHRKKILLYGNILNKKTVTAVALATQKVGLVVQHKEGDKDMAFRAKWEKWTRPAPNLLIPIVTIGVLIDLFVNAWAFNGGTFGIISLVFLILAIAYTIIGFRALFLIIPTERRAGEIALKLIEENSLLASGDIERVGKLYKVYVKKYIADFVMAVLEIIIDILRVIAAFSGKSTNKK